MKLQPHIFQNSHETAMTENQNIPFDCADFLEIDTSQYTQNIDIVISEETCFEEGRLSPSLASSSKKIHKENQKRPRAKTRETGRKEKTFWQPEEDALALELIAKIGFKWTKIGRIIGGRTGKQVRDRYNHSLNPNISKDKWTKEEDAQIISLYQQLGNKWCQIAQKLKGRTENQVKNRFYSKLKDVAGSIEASPSPALQLTTSTSDDISSIFQPEEPNDKVEWTPKLLKLISENEEAWGSIQEPSFGRDLSGISHYFGELAEGEFESLGAPTFRTIPSFSSELGFRDFSMFLMKKNSETRFEMGSGFF